MFHFQKTYAIRMIYIGEHTLSKEEIIRAFEKSVHDVNSAYCEIHVYGLLLVYDSYFVHILEVMFSYLCTEEVLINLHIINNKK